jgi:thiol reductant ABC exporter CydD subunit
VPRTDRRLWRETRAARPHLGVAGGLGVLTAGLILAQAALLAHVIAASAVHHVSLASLRGSLVALGAVLLVRALAGAGFELSGRLGAARVMSELRDRLVRHLLEARPGPGTGERTGELASAAVQGVDALEAYFAAYLPQFVLAAVVPVAVLAWIVPIDPVSAGILAATIPVLVVFMILIGKGAQAQTRRRWRTLSLLSAHFLDVVRGLTTLRLHRREDAQAATLAAAGDAYRRETMGTLRVAFLSALVLELCAMLGTALVAATVGIELVNGHLGLTAGLTVLLLAPELYSPLRQVGQQFHASADGLAAAERIFAVLDRPAAGRHGALPAPDPARHPVAFRRVSYAYPDRPGRAADGLDLVLAPGLVTAIVGPSGGGKSTIAALAAGLLTPTEGVVSCGGTDLAEIDPAAWRARVAWVPQRPHLFAASVADNIRLRAPGASDDEVRAAARAAGALAFAEALPDGLETPLGDGGRRLSAGQAQRIALARAFIRPTSLVILDEPTAHLDAASGRGVADAIDRLRRGRTVLLVTHDAALAERADTVFHLARGRLGAPPPLATPEVVAV